MHDIILIAVYGVVVDGTGESGHSSTLPLQDPKTSRMYAENISHLTAEPLKRFRGFVRAEATIALEALPQNLAGFT